MAQINDLRTWLALNYSYSFSPLAAGRSWKVAARKLAVLTGQSLEQVEQQAATDYELYACAA